MSVYEGTLSRELFDGEYEVIQVKGSARQRTSSRALAGGRVKGSNGNKKVGLKLLTFAAGTITGFGLGAALKLAGVTSGVARSLISIGLSGTAYLASKEMSNAPGTFAYGLAFGSALFSSYEGWNILSDLNQTIETLSTPANYWNSKVVGIGPIGGTATSWGRFFFW